MYENYAEAIAAYDDALDSEGPTEVAGMTFYPSRIVQSLDPIAYRVGFFDWLDGEGIDSDDLDYVGYASLG